MTHIIELHERVEARAQALTRYPDHQRLVYAVENVVETVLPLHCQGIHTSRRFIERVCDEEYIDVPNIVSGRISNAIASASAERYEIVLGGRVNVLTLLHELAHCLTPNAGHTEPWRTKFVQLVRNHLSIDHASLLYHLYNRHNLDCQWQS
jgi:hypothetical protein